MTELAAKMQTEVKEAEKGPLQARRARPLTAPDFWYSDFQNAKVQTPASLLSLSSRLSSVASQVHSLKP